MGRFRGLKRRVESLLNSADWGGRIGELDDTEPKELIGPLFSLLMHAGETRWRAITLFGPTVARLADQRMEEGRIVMRRFMWNLNEESGSLGWGSPEAMAETMAVHEGLAREFHRVLVSYIHDTGKAGNYIDHAPLRKGAFWGVARLANVRPGLMAEAASALLAGLTDREDAEIPGLAAWGLGPLMVPEAAPGLAALADDATPVELFRDFELQRTTVGALAREALLGLETAP